MMKIRFESLPGKDGLSLVAQLVKNPPAMQETWAQSLGWEDPLEKEKDIPFFPLLYSGLENSMDCIVQGVARSQIRLSDLLSDSLNTPCFLFKKYLFIYLVVVS